MGDAAKNIQTCRNQNQRIIKGEELLRTGDTAVASDQEQPKRKGQKKTRERGGSRRAAQRQRRQTWDIRRL